VLDAQYFGVPQRRRHVFIVGRRSGDWRSTTEVLFERESVCGDSDQSRATGEETTRTAFTSIESTSGGLQAGVAKGGVSVTDENTTNPFTSQDLLNTQQV